MEKSNTQLAGKLRWLADYLAKELGWIADDTSPSDLRFAADRLETLSQVTEKEVEAAFEILKGHALPNRPLIRRALEAARKART